MFATSKQTVMSRSSHLKQYIMYRCIYKSSVSARWTCLLCRRLVALWFLMLVRTDWCWRLGPPSSISTSSIPSLLTRRTVWHSTTTTLRYKSCARTLYIYSTQQSCTVAPTSKQRYQKMAMGMIVCINICCTYKLSNTIKCINRVCSFFVFHRSLQSPCLWCLHETSDHNCPVIYLKRCCDNKSVFYKIKCVCVLHCHFFLSGANLLSDYCT